MRFFGPESVILASMGVPPCLLLGAETGNVTAAGLAASQYKPPEWDVGFFFGNTELSLELWTVITGISEFDD